MSQRRRLALVAVVAAAAVTPSGVARAHHMNLDRAARTVADKAAERYNHGRDTTARCSRPFDPQNQHGHEATCTYRWTTKAGRDKGYCVGKAKVRFAPPGSRKLRIRLGKPGCVV